MRLMQIQNILKETDFIHTSGTPEERKVAEILKARCEAMGAKAWFEEFPVAMAEIGTAALWADGEPVPGKGYKGSGNAEIEAPFLYLPNTDPASLAGARGRIVLLDTGVGYFLFQDLVKAGIAGFLTYDGNVHFRDRDIDQKELRGYVSQGTKIPGFNINAKDAFALVRKGTRTIRMSLRQEETEGMSRNVVAELPGERDEWIVLTAHYDTTSLSHGSYDNMSGCIGLLEVLDALKGKKHRYGVRFVFCGSEERGLLGSKAYVEAHAGELDRIALNINLDMIGTAMGRFAACCTSEEKLVSYLQYLCSMEGWGIHVYSGVYSSDSTPFADKGVPAVSFARQANPAQASIHNRYDRRHLLSLKQLHEDGLFVARFAGSMADAVQCPVGREMPERIRKELDEYLNRKRKE